MIESELKWKKGEECEWLNGTIAPTHTSSHPYENIHTLMQRYRQGKKQNSSVGGEKRQQNERKVIDKEVGCIGSKVSRKI